MPPLPVPADVALRRAVRVAVWHLPPRRRGMRLVNLVDRSFPPGSTLFDTTYDEGVRIRCDLRDAVQSSIFYRGVYEPRVTTLFRAEVRPGDTVLDLGANVGYFSLMAARAVGGRGAVHAFEPSNELAARLEADAARNGFAHLRVHRRAVSDGPGTVFLARSSDVGAPAGGRYITDQSGGAAADEPVEMVAVDEYLPDLRFDVAKLDIEGAELRALTGMADTIRRSQPRLMLVEAIPENLARFGASVADVHALMAGLGYRGELVEEPWFSPMIAFRPAGPGGPGGVGQAGGPAQATQ